MADFLLPNPQNGLLIAEQASDELRMDRCPWEYDNDVSADDADDAPVACESGTIRLSTDFVNNPEVIYPTVITDDVKTLRTSLGNKAWSAFELAVERMVVYDSKTQLEDYDSDEWPSDEIDEVYGDFNHDVRKALWHCYLLGKKNGTDEGRLVLNKLLGGNDPSSSKVYKYKKITEPKLLPYGPPNPKAVTYKIEVQTPHARDKIHRHMLFRQRRYLKSVEHGLKEVVKLRVKLAMGRGLGSPDEVFRGLKKFQGYAHEHLWNAVHNAYDIGRFQGFEEGQKSIKKIYENEIWYTADSKIYSFVTTLKGNEIVVDLGSAKDEGQCECQACIHCIRTKTNKYFASWPRKFQEVKDVLDRVEGEFKCENDRKRRAEARAKIHGTPDKRQKMD